MAKTVEEGRFRRFGIRTISIAGCAAGLTLAVGGVIDATVVHPGPAVQENKVNEQYSPLPHPDQIKAAEQTIIDFSLNPSPTDTDRQKVEENETLIGREKARVEKIAQLKSTMRSDLLRLGLDFISSVAGGWIALLSPYKGKQALDPTFMGAKKPKA